jgi:hypothetical protein
VANDSTGLARVVRRGRSNDVLEVIQPLAQADALYLVFANSVSTTEGLLGFVQSFGPLTYQGHDPDQGDLVELLLHHAQLMRDLINTPSSRRRKTASRGAGSVAPGANVYVAIIANSTTTALSWQMRPDTLLDGLWLQFGQSITRGDAIRFCGHCGKLFEAGRGTDRRRDAKFCSDEHRIAFNSLKRSRED